MPGVIKLVGASLLTCAVVWTMVLAWWQSNAFEPTHAELALYLGALPLALIGGFLLLRAFIEQVKSLPAPEHRAVATPDDDPLAGGVAKTGLAERAFQIWVLDSFIESAPGNSADEVIDAIVAGDRPRPSDRLNDQMGFPVFAAEARALDLDAMGSLFSEVAVFSDFAEDARMHRHFALFDSVMSRANDRVNSLLSAAPAVLRRRVICLLPPRMPEIDLQSLQDWLINRYWSQLPASQLFISLRRVTDEHDALRQLDLAVLHANRDPSESEVTIFAAVVSSVDEQSVAELEAAGALFSAKHQDRKIPGEGAVALVLGSRAACHQLAVDDAIPCGRVSFSMRDKPMGTAGRVSGKLLDQLVTDLLDVSGVKSAAMKTVIADTDHRAGHVAELLEGLGGAFGHLDPINDCLAMGGVTGDLAPFGTLMAIACASRRAALDDAPVLCVSNQHEIQRAALVLGNQPSAPDSSAQVALV